MSSLLESEEPADGGFASTASPICCVVFNDTSALQSKAYPENSYCTELCLSKTLLSAILSGSSPFQTTGPLWKFS